MRVIAAPEKYDELFKDKNKYIFCFLAGGITNCWDWQSEVIESLSHREYDENDPELIIFNPRRRDFYVRKTGETRKQIEWEFYAIQDADIFSMYFVASDSDQPICMYELGRNMYKRNLIISIETGYKRTNDVHIQTELALGNDIAEDGMSPSLHADKIYNMYKHFAEHKKRHMARWGACDEF